MKKTILFGVLALVMLAGCASTVKIEIDGNSSVGDNWVSFIAPNGVVQEVSSKYKISIPLPGAPGKFIFKFRGISEGEAGVVLSHYFRGGFRHAMIYDAVVDKNNKLTLTIRMRSDEENSSQNRINTSYDIDMYKKIITDYTEAIEYEPDDAFLYEGRGYFYSLLGDIEKANADFETAENIENNNNEKY